MEKKRGFFQIISIVSLSIFLLAPGCFAYSGGTGEPNSPYQIADVNDLLQLAADTNDYNDCFILTNDINLAGYTFDKAVITPIYGQLFRGVFDGNDHVISNLTIDANSEDYVGLFGSVWGEVLNLGLENVHITGNDSVGGLAARVQGNITNSYSTGTVNGNYRIGGLIGFNMYYNGSVIQNCYSTCAVGGNNSVGGLMGTGGNITDCHATGIVDGNTIVGGLVGEGSDNSYITDCYATGTVSGNFNVGGLIGDNDAIITNCYSTGAVNGGRKFAGGLVGTNHIAYSGPAILINCYSMSAVDGNDYTGGLVGENESVVTNCYSTGSVNGNEDVGGLVGNNNSWGGPGTVSNCYSTSSVTGRDNVGGLVGIHDGETWRTAIITECYSAGRVIGDSNVGGLIGNSDGPNEVNVSFWDIETCSQTTSDGGEGKTTAQMKMLSTFTSAGWDFIDAWNIGENQTYPFLRKYHTGDLNYDGSVNGLDLALFADDWMENLD
ncbi:MAG: hypothetical protein JW806_02565 [Sedimentisphaerales bacterium]|nr:hypothetical protein [Sedimentisphaerales bacterium]